MSSPGNARTGRQAADGDITDDVQKDLCQFERMNRMHNLGEVVADSAMEEGEIEQESSLWFKTLIS